MAEAPVYRRNELPPGQTGLVKPGFQLADTSAQQRLGRTVEGAAGDMWSKIIQADAANEEAEFVGLVKAKQAEYEAKVADQPGARIEDYQTWQNDLLSEIKISGAKAKTGIAKEWIRQWYSEHEKPLKESLNASTQAVVSKRQEEVFKGALKKAIQEGNITETKRLWNSQRDALYPSELINELLPQDLNLASYHKAQNDIAKNPQAFLDIAKTGKLEGYPGLTETQVMSLKEYATGLKRYQENQTEELTTQQIQAIHSLAVKNAPYGEVKAKIDQSDGLTPMQKTQAWKQYNDAMAVRSKTGQNPYVTTQDWNAAMEAYWKAEQGIAPDRNDVGSKYDVQWYEKLKKMATDGPTGKDFEDSKAAKLLVGAIDADNDFTPTLEIAAKNKGLAWLQQELDKADPPLKDREKEELALKIFGELKKQVKTLSLTPESIRTPQEKAELEAKLAAPFRAEKAKDYQPTQAEFRRRVAQLKAQGQERAARKYYDQWKSILWPQ